MHKNATKCNETLSKWCKNKHGASKIIDTLETYHPSNLTPAVACSLSVSMFLISTYLHREIKSQGVYVGVFRPNPRRATRRLKKWMSEAEKRWYHAASLLGRMVAPHLQHVDLLLAHFGSLDVSQNL
jgi:hypothetical protein